MPRRMPKPLYGFARVCAKQESRYGSIVTNLRRRGCVGCLHPSADQNLRALHPNNLQEYACSRRGLTFRLEWKLGDRRFHLMARNLPFLFPVAIDDTPNSDERVPRALLRSAVDKAARRGDLVKLCRTRPGAASAVPAETDRLEPVRSAGTASWPNRASWSNPHFCEYPSQSPIGSSHWLGCPRNRLCRDSTSGAVETCHDILGAGNAIGVCRAGQHSRAIDRGTAVQRM